MRPIESTDWERRWWVLGDGEPNEMHVIGGPEEGDGVIPCPALVTATQVHVGYELDPADVENLRRGGKVWLTVPGGLPVHRLQAMPPELPVADELVAVDSSGREVTIVLGDHLGVRHAGCEHLADIVVELDRAYCSACRWQDSISGSWVCDVQTAHIEHRARATDTVHLLIGWDGDEGSYMHEADVGDADERSDVFEVDVPRSLWDELDAIQQRQRQVYRQIEELVGFDDGRMVSCCDGWVGEVRPGHEWWQLELSASGDPNVWPVNGEAVLDHHRSEGDAATALAVLPEAFWLTSGHALVLVTKDRLSIRHRGWGSTTSECFRCGWSKSEHDTTAEADRAG